MHPSPKPRHARRLLAVQWLAGKVAVAMMFLGQSLAVGAVQSADGVWIEVCGGDGTKMVQVDGDAESTDCDHCDYCTVQFTAVGFGLGASGAFGPALLFVRLNPLAVQTQTMPGAAQYWAANRGPPLASEMNMKTTSALWAALTYPVQRGVSWL